MSASQHRRHDPRGTATWLLYAGVVTAACVATAMLTGGRRPRLRSAEDLEPAMVELRQKRAILGLPPRPQPRR
jgi:hypothetical protein